MNFNVILEVLTNSKSNILKYRYYSLTRAYKRIYCYNFNCAKPIKGLLKVMGSYVC